MDKTIVKIVQDSEGPDLMRQTPAGKGVWDGIHFTYDQVAECDFMIVLRSQMRNPISVACPQENVWAIVQDPYFPGFNDWLVEGYEQFSRIYTQVTHHADDKYIQSQPALPWYVNRSYEELQVMPPPKKKKSLSWILGNQMEIPGHFKRLVFLDHIKKRGNFTVDLFGRVNQYIADKAEGLIPYKYSLAVENSCCPDYWTEKIADCFLCWTVPIYYGCTNLEEYFPADAFIRVDITRPQEALARIKEVMDHDDWEKRLPALKEARHLLLDKHQFFPYFSNLIRKEGGNKRLKMKIEIPVYERSLRSRIHRLAYKQKRTFWRIYYRYVQKCL
jgi:Glycosyltransferase family 10 (fucosyltransferase) C-term